MGPDLLPFEGQHDQLGGRAADEAVDEQEVFRLLHRERNPARSWSLPAELCEREASRSRLSPASNMS
jgi:hypothetical protein